MATRRTIIYISGHSAQPESTAEALRQAVEHRGDVVAGTFIEHVAPGTRQGRQAGWKTLLANLDGVDQVVGRIGSRLARPDDQRPAGDPRPPSRSWRRSPSGRRGHRHGRRFGVHPVGPRGELSPRQTVTSDPCRPTQGSGGRQEDRQARGAGEPAAPHPVSAERWCWNQTDRAAVWRFPEHGPKSTSGDGIARRRGRLTCRSLLSFGATRRWPEHRRDDSLPSRAPGRRSERWISSANHIGDLRRRR